MCFARYCQSPRAITSLNRSPRSNFCFNSSRLMSCMSYFMIQSPLHVDARMSAMQCIGISHPLVTVYSHADQITAAFFSLLHGGTLGRKPDVKTYHSHYATGRICPFLL